MSPCQFELDPRHEWWAQSLQDYKNLGLDICVSENRIAILKNPTILQDRVEFSDRTSNSKYTPIKIKSAQKTALSTSDYPIKYLQAYLKESSGINSKCSLDERLRILDLINAEFRSTNFFSKSRLLLIHLVEQILLTISNVSRINPKIIIANDFWTAFAVNLIKTENQIVVYDAQEIFTEQFADLNPAMKDLFIELEQFTCLVSDYLVFPSPGIESFYLDLYNLSSISTFVVPNFVSKLSLADSTPATKNFKSKFVFLGRFESNRGIELLVESWEIYDIPYILDLYISNTRDIPLRVLNLIQSSKFIRLKEAVNEDEIISTLNSYDVGIIPYNYPYPYSECSPNKFGQYIASGLAVMTNDQNFIKKVTEDFSIGVVFNWGNSSSFHSAIEKITNEIDLRNFKTNSVKAFKVNLNFESQVRPLFLSLESDSRRLKPEVNIVPFIYKQSTNLSRKIPDYAINLTLFFLKHFFYYASLSKNFFNSIRYIT